MNKNDKKPLDFTPISVKNIRTGEIYTTCKAYGKKVIDGIEFTPVVYQNQLRLIRSDSLKKIKASVV